MASLAYPSIATTITLNDGTTYGYARVKATEGKPTLLFLHGYPSAAYDWHKQVKYFSDKGYGIIAPDLLGYGDTSKPTDPGKYGQSTISNQVMQIVDKEGVRKVIGIAHDWGSRLLSTIARLHKDRFSGLVFLAAGYQVPGGATRAGVDTMNEKGKEILGYPPFGYWYFHDSEDAAALIEAHPESYTSLVYADNPDEWKVHLCPVGSTRALLEADKKLKLASWISEAEMNMHAEILCKGGYTGPLNWYKQEMRGVSLSEEPILGEEDQKMELPTLFIRAEKDAVCVPDMQVQRMRPLMKNLEVASVNAGHWLLLEKAEEVNKILEEWIMTKVL